MAKGLSTLANDVTVDTLPATGTGLCSGGGVGDGRTSSAARGLADSIGLVPPGNQNHHVSYEKSVHPRSAPCQQPQQQH